MEGEMHNAEVQGPCNEHQTTTEEKIASQCEVGQQIYLRAEINQLHHQIVQSATERIIQFCSKVLQQLIDSDVVHCQVLFLASTSERVHQIKNVMQALGGGHGVKIHACVDGNSIEEDKHILSAGVHLVVGTPSRVSDLFRTQNQALHSDHVRMFVLDEPDEMLSKGFDRQIHNILPRLPGNVEVVALYPTMPEDALEIARKLMNKPVTMNSWQSIVFLEPSTVEHS
ncbi:eukaryotic initiation factor 4A-13-like [Capsicum galapagoense]